MGELFGTGSPFPSLLSEKEGREEGKEGQTGGGREDKQGKSVVKLSLPLLTGRLRKAQVTNTGQVGVCVCG